MTGLQQLDLCSDCGTMRFHNRSDALLLNLEYLGISLAEKGQSPETI